MWSGCLYIYHLAYFQFKPHTTVTGRNFVIKKIKHLPCWIRSTEIKSRKNLVLLLSLTICPYGLWSNTTCSILFPNHHEKMMVRGSVISLLRKLIIKPACLRKISSGPIRQTKIQNIFKLKKVYNFKGKWLTELLHQSVGDPLHHLRSLHGWDQGK